MDAPFASAMSGEIAEGILPRLLRSLYVGRRSGTLRLSRGGEQQTLRFRFGTIVNATTNVVEDRLGEMLVRRGLLSQDGLARATEIVLRDKRRLGEVLAELGLIDASGLEDAIALHVHEMLARLFTWTDGSYGFSDDPPGLPASEVTLKLSTGELILEAVRAVKDPDVVRYSLGDIDRVLSLSNDPLLRFQQLTLSPADGFLLSRVDGVASAREILQMITLPAEETQRSLFGLLSTGVVEYLEERRSRDAAAPAPATHEPQPLEAAEAPPSSPAAPEAPPAPAPAAAPAPVPAETAPLDPKVEARRQEILEAWSGLAERNHFEVLGIARNVGETGVKEAYFGLAKRFHPDAHHSASLSDMRDKLEAVFIRLGEAYDTLRDPRRRGEYEERLGRFKPRPAQAPPSGAQPEAPAQEPQPAVDPEERLRLADESILKAAKLMEQAKALEREKPGEPEHQRLTYDAIQLLEPVIPVVQGKTRLRAQVLLARGYAKNPKWTKRAEELLLQASRDQPKAAEPWALLGSIYAATGLKARALSMYKKALEANPDHEEAGRYLAENAALEPEPPSEEGGGGLLGRLFRKG